jgi:KUP system potassium uptake protein
MLDPAKVEDGFNSTRRPDFLLKIELRRGNALTMAPWPKRLFIATCSVAAQGAEQSSRPRDCTVIVGA